MSQVIIIPVDHTPATCPSCNKREYIIEVCKHCGYVYPQEKLKWYETLITILIVCSICWAVITLICWLMSNMGGDKLSLFETVKIQYTFVRKLRFW